MSAIVPTAGSRWIPCSGRARASYFVVRGVSGNRVQGELVFDDPPVHRASSSSRETSMLTHTLYRSYRASSAGATKPRA